MTKQVGLFLGIVILGIIIGGHLAAHIFFGIIILIGLIALIENIPLIKWFVYRTNNLIDVMLFIAAGVATVKLGVTITAALTVAGLGYTLVYAPHVRKQLRYMKEEKELTKLEKLKRDINK